jgi:hypothetical protein
MGYIAQQRDFSIRAGEATDIAFELLEDPDNAPPGGGANLLRLGGFAGLGLAVAGLAVGGITGGMALARHNDLSDACANDVCPPQQQGELDNYRTLGSVSTVGFVAGGVLAAVGATLIVLSSKSDEPATVSADARGLRVHF